MKTKKKKRVPPVYLVTTIPMGDTLKSNAFSTLKELNLKVVRVINEYRETWLFALLNNSGIKVDRSMNKRELQEALLESEVVIKKLTNSNLDRVFINDKEVGTWSCNYNYQFNSAGKLSVIIRHTNPSKNLPS